MDDFLQVQHYTKAKTIKAGFVRFSARYYLFSAVLKKRQYNFFTSFPQSHLSEIHRQFPCKYC